MNDELSKLGHPDEDEPIEGRIVPPYQGPYMSDDIWKFLRHDLNQNRASYHFIVDEDGVHDGDTIMAPGGWCVPKDQHYDTGNAYKTGRMYVAPVEDPTDWTEIGDAGVSYEYGFDPGARGPNVGVSYWDEVLYGAWDAPVTVETEFSLDDVSDETFRLLFGQDKNVLIAAAKMYEKNTAPPVDPEHVKWPK